MKDRERENILCVVSLTKRNPFCFHRAQEAINPDNIDVRFEDIGGLEEEKRRLREIVILPFTRPELFSRGKLLRPPKGVLLYGPPGTGKTMASSIIFCKAHFSIISASSHIPKPQHKHEPPPD
jgi:ATP-dependent 26S proteasome regulatory subunit